MKIKNYEYSNLNEIYSDIKLIFNCLEKKENINKIALSLSKKRIDFVLGHIDPELRLE